MSTLPSAEIIDAFYLCLAASVIWAPLVFIGAAFLNRRSGGNAEATVWPSALLIAALPVVAAPVAAAFGLSLRTAKPLPPMAEPEAVFVAGPSSIVAAAPQAPAIELATVFNAIADLYFYGFILFAALGVMRLVGFSYRVRYSYPIDDARLIDGLADWRRRMGVRRPVRFAYSDAVTSVCVHGFIRPVVLMPPSLLERVSTDDAILMGAHELAHVKRGDTWLFAFCSLTRALFWFNPFMRRIIAHAQLAAEQAADALVIRRGVNRKSYARCFVESLKISSGLAAPQHTLVPSFTPFDKRSRRERLDAILSGRAAAPVVTLGGKIVLIASGLLALVLAFGQAALAVAPPPAKDALTVVPVDGRITSNFGERLDPFSKEMKIHRGMDIAAPTGTPVRAAGDGKVIDATSRYNGGTAWGNVVVIDHGHGLVTRYAQLDSYIVRKGDTVSAGDTIGAVGATGRATGPHLHFEVLADGENIDPAPVVVPDAPLPPTPRRVKKVELAPTAPGILFEPASPAAPVDPVEAPVAPDVEIAPEPAPEPLPAPEPTPEPLTPEGLSFGERIELRLAGGFPDWVENMEDRFEFFEWPETAIVIEDENEFVVQIGDIELQGFGDAGELAEVFENSSIDFEDWPSVSITTPQFAYSFDGVQLSDEQREAIERAQERAMRAAENVRRESERQIARAERDMERVMRQFDRAQRDSDRAVSDSETERRRHESERQVERVERELERAVRQIEQADRERERAVRLMERTGREHERAIEESEMQLRERIDTEHREEILRLREDALREAADAIALEREELERLRAELEAEKNQ